MKAKDALAKCQQTIKNRPKQVAAIAVAAIIAVVLVCAFCLRGCDSNDAVGEGPAGTASQTSNDSPLNATAIETGLATMDAEQGVSPNEEQNADAAAGQSAAENGFAGSDSQSAGNGQRRNQARHQRTTVILDLLVAAIAVLQVTTKVRLRHQANSGL
jgi:hypothetical protein